MKDNKTPKGIMLVILLMIFIGSHTSLGAAVTVIPEPKVMTPSTGEFFLSDQTVIETDEITAALGKYAQGLFSPATGFKLPLKRGFSEESSHTSRIQLRLNELTDDLGKEGYTLSVKKDEINLCAATQAGVFYGIQTLRQLLPAGIERSQPTAGVIQWAIPCMEIKDQPRFPWRGLMMDCSRTFWSKEYIHRTIRLMALYKLNHLHLHLTDDQGWRLEIKKYPKLTQLGAEFPARFSEPPEHQGFYSQADIKEIVAYAAQHHVTIVPEIEMPGHALAALACYPELSCTAGPFEIHPFHKGINIHPEIFCAGNERTFEFIEDVLSEVIELFPAPFIHIGGDEAPKQNWKACPKCQARIQTEKLGNEHDLQSYFIKRVEKFVNARGKKIIGWDEILDGGLAPNAAVMSWRGVRGGVAAATAGHDVVMSPTSHCYFDYPYTQISTMRAYAYEPIPQELRQDAAKYILGAQANFWSHIDRSEEKVDAQLFPRLLAIAERTWSPAAQRDENHFRSRVQSHLQRLAALGVKYYPDPSVIQK